MRRSLAVSAFTILSILPVSLLAHQSTQIVTAPTRDTQAIGVLAQSVKAMGGQQALSQLSDLTVSGQFTDELASPPDVKTTRTYIKGLDQVRMETDTPGGSSVVIYAEGDGFQVIEGKKSIIRTHNSAGRRLEFFPLLNLAELMRGSKASVELGDVTTFDGKAVYQIKAAHGFDGDPTSSAILSKASRVEFFIDQQTLLPVAIRYYVHPDSDTRIDWPMEIRFSDYRPANGALFPFSATQSFKGRIIAQLKINSITTNQNLLDSMFR
jgi:hypothetical protein